MSLRKGQQENRVPWTSLVCRRYESSSTTKMTKDHFRKKRPSVLRIPDYDYHLWCKTSYHGVGISLRVKIKF